MIGQGESNYHFRSAANVIYKWRNFACFLLCLYLILQGAMIMILLDTTRALTITTALIPTYVLIFALLLAFPLFLVIARVKVFTCDNFSAWIVLLAVALFTCLGIAELEQPSLGYFVVFMPPIALLIVMAFVYIIRSCIEIKNTANDVEIFVQEGVSHDLS